jgi:hypothetical protein
MIGQCVARHRGANDAIHGASAGGSRRALIAFWSMHVEAL